MLRPYQRPPKRPPAERDPISPRPHRHLVASLVLASAILTCTALSPVVWACMSRVARDAEHVFMCFSPVHPPWGNIRVRPCSYRIYCCCFLLGVASPSGLSPLDPECSAGLIFFFFFCLSLPHRSTFGEASPGDPASVSSLLSILINF